MLSGIYAASTENADKLVNLSKKLGIKVYSTTVQFPAVFEILIYLLEREELNRELREFVTNQTTKSR